MGYIVRTAEGSLVNGRKFYTPSTQRAGSGDQTTGVQAAIDYALDNEIKGLWLGAGTINLSDQLLLRNAGGFMLMGAGAQITGMANVAGVRSAGTRLNWKGDALRAALLMADCRTCVIRDFGFHCDATVAELLSAIDCIQDTSTGIVTPTGCTFQHLSVNGGGVVPSDGSAGAHSGIHFGIRFPTSSSYLPPANAGDANNDYHVLRMLEFNGIQVGIELAGSQQKNIKIEHVKQYGIPFNATTESAAIDTANSTHFMATKSKCIVAVGACYNPSTDAWTIAGTVGGNFHWDGGGGSRSTVADVVIGQANSNGYTIERIDCEGSRKILGPMPGGIAGNTRPVVHIKNCRWTHANSSNGALDTDNAWIKWQWGGSLTVDHCEIDDDKVGGAGGSYTQQHILVEPPSTQMARIMVEHNNISTETVDLVRVTGSNPRRAEITTRGNNRRQRSDDTYSMFIDSALDPVFDNEVSEDFDGGSTTTSQIGRYGWTASSTSHISQATSPASHPGIVTITTTSTSGTFAFLRNQQGSGGTVHNPVEQFSSLFIFRPNNVDANTTFRVGIMTPSTTAPTNGMYLEKLDADTNFFVNCRIAGVETRTDTGIAADTAWHRLRIRRINSTTIGFTLDNGAEITINTNVPTIGLFSAIQIVNSAAAAKTIDWDFFRYRITGLVR